MARNPAAQTAFGPMVLAAVEHVKTDGLGVRGIWCSVDDYRLVCSCDLGVCRLREIGEENVVPEGGTGGGSDVLDVENSVFELFVEDSRLYLEGGLRGCEGFADFDEAGGGTGRGRPFSSMATKVKVASVTFSREWVRKRLAQASIWIFIELRPT